MNARPTREETTRIGTSCRLGRAGALAILLCAATGGCATNQESLIRFLASANNPTNGGPEYRVMPPDVLSITATPSEEYSNRQVKIGPDGKSFLPLIGSYQLAGKTTTELAAELTENLRDYYEDVQVTVTVAQYVSQKFYVLGEVGRPGVYPYTGNDSLLSAVAAAGPSRLAWPERIYLVRGLDPVPGEAPMEVDADGRLTRNAKIQRIRINLMEMARDGDLSANVTLSKNDVIFVPANPFARVGLALQNLLLPASPAISAAGFPYEFRDTATGQEDQTTR